MLSGTFPSFIYRVLCALHQTVTIWLLLFIINLLFVMHLILGAHLTLLVQ